MLERSELRNSKQSNSVRIEVVEPCDGQWNKTQYVEVGKNWFWEDRLEWSDEQWRLHVHSPGVLSLKAKMKDQEIGFAELKVEAGGGVEIKYFGLLPKFVGKGFGGIFLSEVVRFIWNIQYVNRIWLHTCDNDHKNALDNYLKRGFKTYRVVDGRVGG